MKYRVCFAEHEFALPPGESIVGRDGASRIRINHPSVSRRHARLLVVGDAVNIEDLGSKNGVKVNGSLIGGPTRIGDGDIVSIGGHDFALREESAFSVEEVTAGPGQELESYQPPVYRTCVGCRNLLEKDDERCPRCGAEQRIAARNEPWNDPIGRRGAFRVGVRLRGLYVSGTMTLEGEVSDLSRSGAFFACDLLDSVGTACDLLIIPDSDGEVIRFACEVARVASEIRTGLGLRFLHMTPAAESWLVNASEPPQTA
jgi:hypothetical protein